VGDVGIEPTTPSV